MEKTIKIENLNKYFGSKHALNNVCLEIKQGMFGLLGPNGAGKTTLMKTIATLLVKSSGTITVCGVPITKSAKIRKMIGYLPQDFSMYGNMNAYGALDYLATLSGMSKSERKVKVPQMLEKVNLLEQKKKKVKEMSGGMKRRLGIAQSLIHNPAIVIVDEPTAGLDPQERVRFRNLLCEIAKERIVILSTHIVGDIEATCEEIAILNQGKVIFRGTVTELLKIVKNKVYTAEISTLEVKKVEEKYIVTGELISGKLTTVKFIAEEKPFEKAKVCDASVEDAYIYLMKKQEMK